MLLQGRIELINEVNQITDSFKKRDFVLTMDETSDYPQSILIETHQDKVDLLDRYKVGDVVTADINLRGRKWVNPEGVAKYFNTIVAWKIYQAEVSEGNNIVLSQSEQSQAQTQKADWLASDDSDDLPF